MTQGRDFWIIVGEIRSRDDRLKPEFYPFLMQTLDFTLGKLGERRHVSATELLDGMCSYARARFGFLAQDVLSNWGVQRTRDVGRAVFQLVEAGVLSARDEDHPRDFEVEYDLGSRLVERYFD